MQHLSHVFYYLGICFHIPMECNSLLFPSCTISKSDACLRPTSSYISITSLVFPFGSYMNALVLEVLLLLFVRLLESNFFHCFPLVFELYSIFQALMFLFYIFSIIIEDYPLFFFAFLSRFYSPTHSSRGNKVYIYIYIYIYMYIFENVDLSPCSLVLSRYKSASYDIPSQPCDF